MMNATLRRPEILTPVKRRKNSRPNNNYIRLQNRRMFFETFEERAMMSAVTSAGVLAYSAFPGEPNNLTITPGLLTGITDNPNISLLSTCPSAEFLRGMAVGLEATFLGVGGELSFPLIPFDLPDNGVICPTVAGFGSMFSAAVQTAAETGSGSVVAGAPITQDGKVYAKVTADGDDPITDYKLYQTVADPGQTHPDSDGNLNDSVFRAAAPTVGRVVTGNVAGTDRDRFSFDAKAGKRYVVMLDQDPERDGTITSTRLKAYTVGGVITNSPLAQNISVVGGNAIGPFSVGADQKLVVDVENTGVGAGTSYRFVVAEFNDGDSVSQPEGPQTIASNDASLPKAIPDGSTTISTLDVGLTGKVTDVNVTLNITHSFDSDLVATLISPSGNRIRLFSNVGGDGDNFSNTTFDDDFSFNPIDSGSAPFSSTFSPKLPLSTLNGEQANGQWKLELVDGSGNGGGTLNSWSLTLTTDDNSDTSANATDLPAGHYGSASIDPARDIDFWSRSGVTSGGLAFAYVDTFGSAQNKDSRLELLANDGTTTLEQADDGGSPGVTDQAISDIRSKFAKAGLQAGSDFTSVIAKLGDRDDTADLSALSLPTNIDGGAGMDNIIGGLGDDVINGGEGSDTIQGSAGKNMLIGGPGDDTFIVDTEHGADDTLIGGDGTVDPTIPAGYDPAKDGFDTIFVPPSSQKNDISVCLNRQDLTHQAVIDISGVTTNYYIPHNDIDEIQISGGDGEDRLNFQSCGLTDNEIVVYRPGPEPGSGSITVIDSSGNAVEPPVTFDGIEQIDLLDGNLRRADGSSRLVVFSDQSFAKGANDTTNLATHLGAGGAVNLDPAIFPAGDIDNFQFVAQYTGTLDFHTLFETNAALPGNGDLSIEVRDANGNVIASGTPSADGLRAVIPAVKDQVYFLRVQGATGPSINDYDLTVINTPAPVPTEVDLDQTNDSGASKLDQVTNQTTTLHYLIHADLSAFADSGITILTPAQATAGVTAGAAVQVFDQGVPVGYATAVPGTNNKIFDLQFNADLAKFPVRGPNAAGVLGYDGFLNAITAAVKIFDGKHDATNAPTPAVGQTEVSVPLSVTNDNIAPLAASIPDLLPSSDSGQFDYDNVTLFNALALQGTGEANTHVVIYANGNIVGQGTVGTDATDGDPTNGLGKWEITTEPLTPSATPYLITAQLEDLAGNLGPLSTALHVLIDNNGPQVTSVFISDAPSYNLFGIKPNDANQGPTPAVNSLTIRLQDLPARDAAFFATYFALNPDASAAPGNFVLIGDATGIVAIQKITLLNDPVNNGQPATASIKLDFATPLLDDRYTLTIKDSVVDPAGNGLDGESNAAQPSSHPSFASGNGLPGGDFVARFTVDSRPEIGNYSAGSAFIDINGNYVIDPQGNAADVTNRDLTFQIGTVSDGLFAGKFEPAVGGDNDGFDKLGAYGFDNAAKKYRFLLDFDHDGISDLRIVSAFQVNGSAVAGNFAPGHNGDEIGLFDGKNWYLDNVGDNQLHLKIPSNMRGQPIVGDFNGDGKDDLATYDAKSNTFFFDTNRDGQTDDTIVFSGPLNGTTETAVTGDLNLDGIDDLGLRVTGRQGSPTPNIAEWYFVLSDHTNQSLPHNVFDTYAPSPLGNDLFAQFGDYVSLPIMGNFDPPIGAGSDGTSQTNVLNSLDVNNDGVVSAQDALIIINQLNGMAQSASADEAQYVDVDGDGVLTPMDVLAVINSINNSNAQSNSQPLADAQGEAADDALTATVDSAAKDVQDDLLLLLASDSAASKQRSKAG
jgi:subtilisin-like proprotein convertase family protein